MKEEHSNDVMTTLIHATEVHERIDTGGKRTVQPTTTLGDEFRSTFGYISFTLGGLDIRKMPFGTSLGDKLETENTIFG